MDRGIILGALSSLRAHKKILVVDDDPETVDMIGLMLDDHGYEIYKAFDGARAVEQTNKHHMDLILMDQRMPIFSGIWFSHALKRKSNTRNIPIVLVSAYIDELVMEKGREVGISDYLKKPFRTEDLLKIVEKNVTRF